MKNEYEDVMSFTVYKLTWVIAIQFGYLMGRRVSYS